MFTTRPTEITEKKRILVVDDKIIDTQLVKHCLERTNYYVVKEVNDPKKALAAAAEFRPHLILLDVRMPGMDGGALAEAFQADPGFKDVPIVFLTSLLTREEIAGGGGLGGRFPMLAKPIILPELIACLREQLRL